MIENIAEIKQGSDIVEVIEKYVLLKKYGVNYKGLCPFHNEKSPSFTVSHSKQIFTCFGCGESGDVFAFLSKIEGVEFLEAVRLCANIAGINIVEKNAPYIQDKKELSKKLELLNDYFKQCLLKEEKIVQYLIKRGISLDTMRRYDLGYINNPSDITRFITKKEALDLGIFNQNGACYLHNRIIFCVRDRAHKIIGFSGRSHPYYNFSQAPKYINPKESFLYKKSQNLYLLSFAKSSIKNNKKIFIVEGYVDAIAAHVLGIEYAVGICGAAFNKNHLSALYPLVGDDGEIIFCLDNDEAGRSAMARAILLCLEHGVYNVHCALLDIKIKEKPAKDLGDILAHEKQPKFIYMQGLEFFIKYYFKHAKTPKEKDNIIQTVKNIIQKETNFYQKHFLIDSISHITKIEKNYFLHNEITQANIPKNALISILVSIANNEECRYIAEHEIIKEAFVEYKNDLERLLAGEMIEKYALSDAALDTESFFMELTNVHISYFKSLLHKAKASKNIEQIINLTKKIQELKDTLRVNMLF